MRSAIEESAAAWLSAIILMMAACAGCSSSASNEELPAPKFEAPGSLTIAGEVWSRKDALTPSDQRLLTDYFTRNSSLTEGDAVRGAPVVYRHGDHRARFYWFRSEGDEAAWFCLEIQGNRIASSEGRGIPQ